MKITISSYAGFCFGVDRALQMMERVIKTSKKPILMLGSLVHNEHVVSDLKKKGVEIIKSLDQAKDGTLVITAHGIDPKVIITAKTKNLYVINTTCPMVIKVHELAKLLLHQGYQIVIFGDRDHMEVKGINGAIDGRAIILGSVTEAKNFDWSRCKKVGLVSQTTQSIDDFDQLVRFIRERVDELKIFDTICESTRGRQEDIKKLARENEAVVVIGSKTSANTNRLYEAALRINKKTYFVQDKNDLKLDWFLDSKSIGISAGASTPKEVIKGVVKSLKQKNKRT